jgi:hypothetical protein
MITQALAAPTLAKGVKPTAHFHASPQQLGLKLERSVADFARGKGAVMRQAEPEALAWSCDNLSKIWFQAAHPRFSALFLL